MKQGGQPRAGEGRPLHSQLGYSVPCAADVRPRLRQARVACARERGGERAPARLRASAGLGPGDLAHSLQTPLPQEVALGSRRSWPTSTSSCCSCATLLAAAGQQAHHRPSRWPLSLTSLRAAMRGRGWSYSVSRCSFCSAPRAHTQKNFQRGPRRGAPPPGTFPAAPLLRAALPTHSAPKPLGASESRNARRAAPASEQWASGGQTGSRGGSGGHGGRAGRRASGAVEGSPPWDHPSRSPQSHWTRTLLSCWNPAPQ